MNRRPDADAARAPTRRRFLLELGALPLLGGALTSAGCSRQGDAARAVDAGAPPGEGKPAADVPASDAPTSCFIAESGYMGWGGAFSLGILICRTGSAARFSTAIAAMRDGYQYRRRTFSRHGDDFYRERFAIAATEYLLASEDVEFHALLRPAARNARTARGVADRKAHRQEVRRESYGWTLDRLSPRPGDRARIVQHGANPAEMDAAREVVAANGTVTVETLPLLPKVPTPGDDLMQLCDYLTFVARQGPQRARAPERVSAPTNILTTTDQVFAALLTHYLGRGAPARLAQGQLAHPRFSITST